MNHISHPTVRYCGENRQSKELVQEYITTQSIINEPNLASRDGLLAIATKTKPRPAVTNHR